MLQCFWVSPRPQIAVLIGNLKPDFLFTLDVEGYEICASQAKAVTKRTDRKGRAWALVKPHTEQGGGRLANTETSCQIGVKA